MCLLQRPGYPKRDERKFLPYRVNVQADQSLSVTHYCGFYRALARQRTIKPTIRHATREDSADAQANLNLHWSHVILSEDARTKHFLPEAPMEKNNDKTNVMYETINAQKRTAREEPQEKKKTKEYWGLKPVLLARNLTPNSVAGPNYKYSRTLIARIPMARLLFYHG